MGGFVKGDVVVLPFPFSDLSVSKKRPALVIATMEPYDDVILCMITSKGARDTSSIPIAQTDFVAGSLPQDSNEALFASLPDTEVVGEAATGAAAVTQAEKLQPDVVLMDIQMPGVNGIEATRQIVQTSPHIGVIVVTMFEDDDSVFAAMRAGARGYVLKGANQEEMLRAIRAVARGEALFGPVIAARLADYFNAPQATAVFPDLTEREREVLHLLAQDDNNQAIAGKLVISVKTVRNHVSNIFSKLQVADRAQAIIRARDAGLGRER